MASAPLFAMARRFGCFANPGWKDRYFSFVYVEDLADVLIASMKNGERLTATSLAATQNPNSKAKFCSGKGIYFATAPAPILFSEFGRMIGRAYGRKHTCVFRTPPLGVLGVGAYGEILKSLKLNGGAMDFNKANEALRGPWICSGDKATEQLGAAISPDLESKVARAAQWYANQ